MYGIQPGLKLANPTLNNFVQFCSMTEKFIQLKAGKDAPVKRFHPWVFSGAIERYEAGIFTMEVLRLKSAHLSPSAINQPFGKTASKMPGTCAYC